MCVHIVCRYLEFDPGTNKISFLANKMMMMMMMDDDEGAAALMHAVEWTLLRSKIKMNNQI